MGGHAAFLAHRLDPQEWQAVERALAMARHFRGLHERPAAARGIETGRLRSIVYPVLADHVRQETVKFIEELKRAVDAEGVKKLEERPGS